MSLSPEQQQQALGILDELLDLADEDRQARLEHVSAGDPWLQAELEALLVSAAAGTVDALAEPAFSIHDDEDLTAGDSRIGPYRPQRLLGRGGMGVVYLAVRDDAQSGPDQVDFRHTVALKVIRRGLETADILRRFHHERRILADLHHSNIARLLDGGTTADGRPWFAMEYVCGEPIDRYCDRERLSIRQRLQLFAKVCCAVRVAHQSLVVHRDLKPANILVDGSGEPWLLDFGIARLLQDGSDSGHQTMVGRRVLTPACASPEQVRGEPVTTVSDVYSLGVLLYRLLTGQPPYEVAGSPAEIERVICEQEPRPPSSVEVSDAQAAARASDPRRLRRRLAGDLDCIVLKALRKEPGQRYGSVEQLVNDLERYLDGRPVLARAGTAAYRAGRFLRRHRLRLAAALLVVLVLGFLAAVVVQRSRIARERDRAERMSVVLGTLLETVQPSSPRPETSEIKQALDGVSDTLKETFGDSGPLDSDGALDHAALLDKLGRAYRSHGFYSEAEPLLEQALAIRRRHLGERHPEVADSLNNLGFLHQQAGDLAAAERLLRDSLAIKEEHYGAHDPRLASSLNNLALVLRDSGRYSEAELLLRRVLELKRQRLGDGSTELIVTQNNLAAVLVDRGAYAEAVAIYRNGLQARLRQYGPVHRKVSLSRNSLAHALYHQGELAEAAELYREDLRARTMIYGLTSPEVARIRSNLGVILQAQGRLQEAEDQYRTALEIQVAGLHQHHGDLAATRRSLASLLAESGRADEAEPLARQALDAVSRTHPADSWLVAYSEAVLGACLSARGEDIEAEDLLARSFERLQQLRGERSPFTRNVKRWYRAHQDRVARTSAL